MGQRINVEKAIRKLREVEVLQSQGASISEACRKLGIEVLLEQWRREYNTMKPHSSIELQAVGTRSMGMAGRGADRGRL